MFLSLLPLLTLAASPMAHVEGRSLSFDLDATPLENLAYQLDCFAEETTCSPEGFRALWSTLGWSSDDDAAVKRWKQTRARYGSAELELPPTEVSLPLDLPSQVDLGEKIRIATFGARSHDELEARLELLMLPTDVAVLREVLTHFEPRFMKWWTSGPARSMPPYARRMAKLFVDEDLAGLTAQAARFYQVDLSKPRTVSVHLIALPKSQSTHSSGTQIERHAVLEVHDGEDPKDRVDVMLHELCHFFFALMPLEQRLTMVRAFVTSSDPSSVAGYGLIDEALATAFGQGLVARRVNRARFEKTLTQPDGFYNDPAIDRSAKAVLPLLERSLGSGGTLDAMFVASFLDLSRTAIGAQWSAPSLDARTLFAAIDESLATGAAPLTGRDLPALLPRMHDSLTRSLTDVQARKQLATLADTLALVIVSPDRLDQLEPWRSVLGGSGLAKLMAQRRRAPFVFGIRRSSKAFTWVFVVRDLNQAKEQFASFNALLAPVEGIVSAPDGGTATTR